jgi:hypothetical protein
LVGSGEPSDGGAEDAGLDDVIAAADLGRAVPDAHPQRHARDHRALAAKPLDVGFQPVPGVASCSIDDVGPPDDLAITRPPAGLASGLPVVVTRLDRDAEHEPDRHPARHDQLGEILPGQVRGEGRELGTRPTALRAVCPDRRPQRHELLPPEQKRPA